MSTKKPTQTQTVADMQEQLRDAETRALMEWRKLCHAHAAGRPVDIDTVVRLAGTLGADDAVVAFAKDCETILEERDAIARLEEERADLKHATALAVEAEARIWDLRQEVATAEQAIQLPQIVAHGVSVAEARIRQIRRSSPRLFIEQTAVADAPPSESPVSLGEAWHAYRKHRLGAPAPEAEFVADDGRD